MLLLLSVVSVHILVGMTYGTLTPAIAYASHIVGCFLHLPAHRALVCRSVKLSLARVELVKNTRTHTTSW